MSIHLREKLRGINSDDVNQQRYNWQMTLALTLTTEF